ncbi:PTS sugar transporter subunit IIC, partial [Lactobacillus rhamnosus]|nr:PTS sugar transporter subunit IIC [Lacticaseibacillus rhamnosus]
LKVPILGVAIIGLALAIYTYQNLISASKKREVAAANNAGTTDDDEGDDYDE